MSKFGFDVMLKDFERLKVTLPPKVGNKAQLFFVRSFTRQGFPEGDSKKWQEVKRRIKGTDEYKYPKRKDLGRRTRAILVGKGSGRLRRAVGNSLKTARFDNISFSVETPYAVYHNEGVEDKNLPKRQFMGSSAELDRTVMDMLTKEMDKIMRKQQKG